MTSRAPKASQSEAKCLKGLDAYLTVASKGGDEAESEAVEAKDLE